MIDSNHTKILAYNLANRPLALVIVETGIFVLIALTALVGNSCVLYVFFKTPSFRKVVNYYLITLAISDVALAGFVMPFAIGAAACGRDIIGNDVGQATGFIGLSLVYGSLQTTTLIAINRFLCVAKPTLYRKYFKPKRAEYMIIVIWIISICFNGITYWTGLLTFEFYPDRLLHFPFFSNNLKGRVLTALIQFLFVIVPVSIAIACYWRVYKVVKGHSISVSSTLHAGPARNPGSSISKEEIHITKSVLAIVCGFVFCWIPCSTIYHVGEYVDTPRFVGLLSTYTAYTSSAVNPIVFNIFNKPFRKQFLKMFCSSPKLTVVGIREENTR